MTWEKAVEEHAHVFLVMIQIIIIYLFFQNIKLRKRLRYSVIKKMIFLLKECHDSCDLTDQDLKQEINSCLKKMGEKINE